MLWAIIMAGGKGTRFWPESRNARPKQFLSLFGRETLIQQTVTRLSGAVSSRHVLVVTQQDKKPLVRRLLKIPSSQIIGEPVGRNTAPCLILTAALIYRKDPDAVLAMLPADHLVEKTALFRKAVLAAAEAARETGLPVTFGIRPAYPATGYGYLEMDAPAGKWKGFRIFRLKRFHEKPAAARARSFVKSGRFLWNSGMFVWKAASVLEAARRYMPEALDLAGRITAGRFEERMRRHFHEMPDISIDYGLMEKIKGKILTLPVDFGWNDVGGWKTIYDLASKDKQKNAAAADSVLIDSSGNLVKASGGRLVALIGVKDHVVIDTPDALLICPKDRTEHIRQVVDALQKKKLTRYL